MKLRTRVAVTAVAVLVPLVVTLVIYDNVARRRAASLMLQDFAVRIVSDDREQCEGSPETWGGNPVRMRGAPPGNGFRGPHDGEAHRRRDGFGPPRMFRPLGGGPGRRPRPATFFAYDGNFHSKNPAAPPVSKQLRDALGEGLTAVDDGHWWSPEISVLARSEHNAGPCALVLARGTTGEWGAVLPAGWFWTVPMLVVFASIFLALGPVVRRIQALTDSVQRSADASYTLGVEVQGNDEVARLARAFETAGAAIRAQLLERETRETVLREYIANTTHDVMIPLTVLQGHLTSLREGAAAGVSDPAVIIEAMNEAHYLASLVHNLAAMARLDGPQAHFQPGHVDLNALVTRVVSRHSPIADERGIAIECATPANTVHAWADVTLLEQAISNITYNAVRYNRTGGHVAVILETTDNRFSIRVVDDGPGVSPADLAQITQRGVRGNDARTRAPEGQGFGLHIAFRSAELHGFTLALVHSEYGGLEARLEGVLDPRTSAPGQDAS